MERKIDMTIEEAIKIVSEKYPKHTISSGAEVWYRPRYRPVPETVVTYNASIHIDIINERGNADSELVDHYCSAASVEDAMIDVLDTINIVEAECEVV